jgi:hypothetical protein
MHVRLFILVITQDVVTGVVLTVLLADFLLITFDFLDHLNWLIIASVLKAALVERIILIPKLYNGKT